MAGKRIITPEELEIATGILAANKDLTMSKGEGGSLTLMPGDILIKIEDGRPKASSPEIQEAIMEILMDMTENAPLPPNVTDMRPKKGNVPAPTRNGNGGQMAGSLMPVRDIQVAELTMDDIKAYICPDATDSEAYMFLQLCKARNLNPFTREAYLVKYGGKANMIVGKEAFTRKAELNPNFDGFRAGIVIDAGVELEGSLVPTSAELIGGWAEVYRKDRKCPFKAVVSLKEYSKNQATWKDMPATMIRKVAIVSALREAFACDLGGCYSSEEMGIDGE